MSRACALSLLAVCFLSGCAAIKADQPIVMGPYVNRVDASSARILWVSKPEASAVRVGIKGDGRELDAVSVPAEIAGRDELLHTVALDGLKAFTRYDYRIGAVEGSFRTAPQGTVPFRFVVYGDTRSRPQSHRSVSEAIAKEDPVLVVCTGDLVANGEVWEQWKPQFFDAARSYLGTSVLWPVRGNHEMDAVFYRELFDLPGNELYYSFDFANVHFVVLDTQIGDGRREMLEWLEKDLAGNDAEWTLVSYHVPTFNVGGHGSKWGREDFLPLMEEHGVDFVLTGHSHVYERFVPIGPAGKKPLIHIVTGGGGAPTYDVKYSPLLAGGIGRSELHYCVFEVDGNRCEMTVKRPDGSVIDTLSLVKTDGMYQDEVMALGVETEMAKQTAFIFADLRADFEVIPRSGQSTQAAISAEGLPPEMTVTIAPVEGAGGWQLESQTLVVRDGRFVFEVRAPEDMSAGLAGFDPPLRMALTVTHEGRAFSVGDVEVGLGEDTLRRVIPAPEPVGIAYAEAAVTVDGDLPEWRDISPMPLPFLGKETGALRFCWREEGLYGAVAAKDDSVEANPKEPWRADTVEVFIEKDFARSLSRTTSAAQYAFSPAPEAGPGPGHALSAYGATPEQAARLECAWRPVAGGYALEFFIPAGALEPARMEAGYVMGMHFALSDGGRAVEQFYCDKDPDGWKTPIMWGAVRLEK